MLNVPLNPDQFDAGRPTSQPTCVFSIVIEFVCLVWPVTRRNAGIK